MIGIKTHLLKLEESKCRIFRQDTKNNTNILTVLGYLIISNEEVLEICSTRLIYHAFLFLQSTKTKQKKKKKRRNLINVCYFSHYVSFT